MKELKQIIFKIRFPLIIGIFSRILVVGIIQIGFLVLPVRVDYRIIEPFPHRLFLNGLIQMDAGWYGQIADKGYSNTPSYKDQTNLAFMPFYPIAIHTVKSLGINTWLSGVLVSNLSFILAMIILYRLLNRDFSRKLAQMTIILLAFYPFSFFFSAMYAESLFLMLSITAWYFAKNNKWLYASIFSTLAAVTREIGFVVGLVITSFFIRNNHAEKMKQAIFIGVSSLLGPFIFIIYLLLYFGSPLVYLQSHFTIGRLSGVSFWEMVRQVLSYFIYRQGPLPIYYSFNIMHVILGLLSVWLLFKFRNKIRGNYFWYSLLALSVSFLNWKIMGRALCVIFPLFLCLAFFLQKHIRLYYIYLCFSLLFLTFFTLMFANGYAIGQ